MVILTDELVLVCQIHRVKIKELFRFYVTTFTAKSRSPKVVILSVSEALNFDFFSICVLFQR